MIEGIFAVLYLLHMSLTHCYKTEFFTFIFAVFLANWKKIVFLYSYYGYYYGYWCYCKFFIFNMAVVRHLEFLKYANFHLLHGLWSRSACFCKILSRSVERFWSYCKFSITNMVAVRHVGFCVCAKFGRYLLNSCRVIASFWFLIWRPSAILDSLYAYAGPPTKWHCWSLLLCKIWFKLVEYFW